MGKHVHKYFGAGGFGEDVTYESLRAAECTSGTFFDDKSLYWQPGLYYAQEGSGGIVNLDPTGGAVISWTSDTAEGETLVDMPGGLRMITGDPSRAEFDDANLGHQAVGFSCECHKGTPENPEECTEEEMASVEAMVSSLDDLKNPNCKVIRIHTKFPNCWNGIDLDR